MEANLGAAEIDDEIIPPRDRSGPRSHPVRPVRHGRAQPERWNTFTARVVVSRRVSEAVEAVDASVKHAEVN